jgi:hypothetical protein
MARRVNQTLWETWRKRLQKQQASGLSVVEFCRRAGLGRATFHAWKRKLRGTASIGPGPARAGRPRRAGRQPIAVSSRPASPGPRADAGRPARSADFLQLPVRRTRSSPWIELTLVDGTVVRIPQENLAAFTALLSVLREGGIEATAGEVRHA